MDVLENTIQSSQSTGHHPPHTENPRAVISACVTSAKVPSLSFLMILLSAIVHSIFFGVSLVIGYVGR